MEDKLIRQLQEEDLFPEATSEELKARKQKKEQRKQEILSGASSMTLPEALEILSEYAFNIEEIPRRAKYTLMDLDSPDEIQFCTVKDLIWRATTALKKEEGRE